MTVYRPIRWFFALNAGVNVVLVCLYLFLSEWREAADCLGKFAMSALLTDYFRLKEEGA